MRELWEHAIHSYNLPFTILLGVVIAYWLLCVIGLFGVDMLDDLFDGDADTISSVPGKGAAEPTGIMHSTLRFLNATDVPLMVVLSLLSVSLWAGSIILNHFANPARLEWLAACLLVPNVIIALIVTRLATQPLAPLMRRMREHSSQHTPLVGREGTVRTADITTEFGQVELDGEGSHVVAAKLPTDHAPLPRGARVLVITEADDRGRYTVRTAGQNPS